MLPTRHICLSLFLLLGTTSCATTVVAPIGKEAVFALEQDEKRLWNRSAEEQKRLDRSGLIYTDQRLESYLNEVAGRLTPEEVTAKGMRMRVKVIKNSSLNAFAFPDGAIYIHTGMLARMENEAQLATVLAHEMLHVTHRHALQNFRNLRTTAAALATLQVATLPTGGYGALAGVLGTIGAMASISGYSKGSEEEADTEGLDLVVKAGYDPAESPKVFERMQREVEEEHIREPFFFGSHPHLEDRKESYARLLQSKYAGQPARKQRRDFKI